jgi:hypothetical protein
MHRSPDRKAVRSLAQSVRSCCHRDSVFATVATGAQHAIPTWIVTPSRTSVALSDYLVRTIAVIPWPGLLPWGRTATTGASPGVRPSRCSAKAAGNRPRSTMVQRGGHGIRREGAVRRAGASAVVGSVSRRARAFAVAAAFALVLGPGVSGPTAVLAQDFDVSVDSVEDLSGLTAVVAHSDDGVNFRAEPGPEGEVLDTLPDGRR